MRDTAGEVRTPTHELACAGRLAKTYINQRFVYIGWILEELPESMDGGDG